MNNPVPGFNDGNERKATFLKSLTDFTKEHRAAHWAGTFASFLEQIFPNDARGIARTSHQYIWDMMRAEGFDDSQGRFRCQLFEDELYGIDDTDRAGSRLLQGRERRFGGRQAPAAAARAAFGRQVELVILLKRGTRGIQLHRRRRAVRASTAARSTSRRCTSCRIRCGRQFRETYGVDITGELCPHCVAPPASTSSRRFHADAGRAHLHLGSRPHRRGHLRAARPDHRRHRRPGRLGRSFEGLGVRRRGRPARLVLVAARCSRRAAACSR